MSTQSTSVPPSAADSLRSSSCYPYRTLSEVSRTSIDNATPLTRSRLARCATDLLVAASGLDVSGLALFDSSNRAHMLAASNHRSEAWEHLVVEAGDGVATRVLKKGGAMSLKNYAAESCSSTHLIDVYCHDEAAYGLLAVPIHHYGSILGILYGGLRTPQYVGDRGRNAAHNVAKLFSATLDSAEQNPAQALPSPAAAVSKATDATLSAESKTAPKRGGVLTARERRILELLAEGLSTRNIAANEYLALNTVRSYVQSTLWKLGAHTRLQAVAVARNLGLV